MPRVTRTRSGHGWWLLLLAVPAVASAASYEVGTFFKTMAASPTSQVVAQGLGQTPKALILWTEGSTVNGGWVSDMSYASGFTDGTASYSVGGYEQNGTVTTNS